MQKKLKKVEGNILPRQMKNEIEAKLQALSLAYAGNDGHAVDIANKEIFNLIDTTILKGSYFEAKIKNHTWQRNHLKILANISTLMQELNRMPTNTEISIAAGLSEETVYKHLREFKEHELYQHENDKYRLMLHRILTKVFNLGVQGDIRACKVYLDYFISNSNPQAPALRQTNYIQINQTKLSQEFVQQLTAEQLNQIEAVLQGFLNIIPKI